MENKEKSKGIKDLTHQECREFYAHILENSEEHFKIADILAGNKMYGQAIAHLVLGSEELVKALIIFLDGVGFEIRRIDNIEDFFKYHKIRHFFNSTFQIASGHAQSVNELLTRYYLYSSIWNQPQTELDLALYRLANFGSLGISDDVLQSELEKLVKPYRDEMFKCAVFWGLAEQWKQQGFYVDYNGGIESPKMLNAKNYEFAYNGANSIRKQFFEYIKSVNSLSEKDKKEFVKGQSPGFYSLFTDAMEATKNFRKRNAANKKD